MRVSEIAKALGITSRAIYHYEDCGLIRPKRDIWNYRMFGTADVELLVKIAALRAVGISIPDIQDLIQNATIETFFDSVELLKRLEDRYASVEEQRETLFALINRLRSIGDSSGKSEPTVEPALRPRPAETGDDGELAPTHHAPRLARLVAR
jgi:DNA-binding transcriptional MerR regulator